MATCCGDLEVIINEDNFVKTTTRLLKENRNNADVVKYIFDLLENISSYKKKGYNVIYTFNVRRGSYNYYVNNR